MITRLCKKLGVIGRKKGRDRVEEAEKGGRNRGRKSEKDQGRVKGRKREEGKKRKRGTCREKE